MTAAHSSAQPMPTLNPTTNQTVHHFKFQQTKSTKVSYLLFLPKGYDGKAAKRWPLRPVYVSFTSPSEKRIR